MWISRPVSTIGSVSDYEGLAGLRSSGGCGFEPRAGQVFITFHSLISRLQNNKDNCRPNFQFGRLAQLVVCLTTKVLETLAYQEVAGSSPVLVILFCFFK